MHAVIVTVSRNNELFDSMADKLAERKISWIRCAPGDASLDAIGRRLPNLVIVESDGNSNSRMLSCVEHIKNRYSSIPVILIARRSSEALAISALKAGVDDYFKIPFSERDLFASIDERLPWDRDHGGGVGKAKGSDDRMVGGSGAMDELKDQLARIARTDSTVLITGETGTGKELAARLIHENSPRAPRPMVSVNCAALPDSLVESELFGYERGAFTGAVARTRGRFEQAHGGTLFLDEIGDMTPFAQAKILRAIDDNQITKLGSAVSIPLDFRLIAATNRDPETLMAQGAFRDDLYYRLNVARVHMPSLREHREDIEQLVTHGIRRLNQKFNRNVKGLRKNVVKLLMRYEWRGNVRELMNVLEGTYVNMPSGHIDYVDLPAHFKKKLSKSQNLPSDERRRILTVLLETNWNKSTAAAKLNWSRMTLYRKIAKHRIVEKRNSRQTLMEAKIP